MHGNGRTGLLTPSLGLAALLLMPGPGAAAREELLVTGTRLAAPEAAFVGAGTVIDRPDIEVRNQPTVLELLRDVPGLQVSQPGAGGVPQVFVRGGEPNFTVFLLDGIRVNDLNNTRGGSFDLSAVNLADVERIEIIRGPQSAIYGSDGLAGVINLISRSGGASLTGGVEAEVGTEDFRRGSLRLAGPAGPGSFSLQATRREDGEATPGSTYEASSVTGRVSLPARAGFSGNLVGRFADNDATSFPEDSGGPRLAVLPDLDTRSAREFSLGADLDWRSGGPWSVQGLVAYYDRDDRYDSPGIVAGVRDGVPPNGAANELERWNLGLRTTRESVPSLRYTVGLDFQREEGESAGYVDFLPGVRIPSDYVLERDILGVFGEFAWQANGALLLQGSLRHDEPDEASGETTFKAGALYVFRDGATRLRLNVGTGFKLPSFFALGSPLVGNPDLRPETSRSLDLGLSRSFGGDRVDLAATVFAADYRDLIDFDPDDFTNVNRDKVTSRGIEFGGRARVTDGVEVRAQATYTDLELRDDTTRRLLQRPEWRASTGLRWRPAAGWVLDLAWLYVGSRYDSSVPTGQLRLNDYQRVDLSLGWQAMPAVRLALAVDNLLHSSYEEAIGFPATGIRPRFTFAWGFGS